MNAEAKHLWLPVVISIAALANGATWHMVGSDRRSSFQKV